MQTCIFFQLQYWHVVKWLYRQKKCSNFITYFQKIFWICWQCAKEAHKLMLGDGKKLQTFLNVESVVHLTFTRQITNRTHSTRIFCCGDVNLRHKFELRGFKHRHTLTHSLTHTHTHFHTRTHTYMGVCKCMCVWVGKFFHRWARGQSSEKKYDETWPLLSESWRQFDVILHYMT